jgi:hypothetical protein
LLPAPSLSEPEDGDEFCPTDEITLKWKRWEVRPFQANEFYAVRIWKDEPGSYEKSRHWEQDPRTTSYHKRIEDEAWYIGDGRYHWNVVVLFDTGKRDEKGNKIWEEVSEESACRHFVVLSAYKPPCIP